MACTYLPFGTHSPALTLGAVDVLIKNKQTNFHNTSSSDVPVPAWHTLLRHVRENAQNDVTSGRSLNMLHVLKPLAGLGVKTRKRRPAVTSPSRLNPNNNITNAALYTNRNYLLRILKEININHYSRHTWITIAFAS